MDELTVQDEATLLSEHAYHLPASRKRSLLLAALNARLDRHRLDCPPFSRLLQSLPGTHLPAASLEDLPMLPVQLFKLEDLLSVPRDQVLRQLTSSGTTGQRPSRIFLDRDTAAWQTKALVMIVKSFLGRDRLPMIVVDARSSAAARASYSARAAAILGFSIFGREHLYLLDEQMRIDWHGLELFMEKHKNQRILLFGFTYIVWSCLYHACVREGRFPQFPDAVLIHGGGWKKLQDQQVDNADFKSELRERFAIGSVHNYYGMVEQVGSIYMECEAGFLHAPAYADVLVRDPITLRPLPYGSQGIIQTFSILPRSYPGNSLLTEDLGLVVGEDDCACGRLGKYFLVQGRLPATEVRGCSDTLAAGLATA
jgi:hypothetical protein